MLSFKIRSHRDLPVVPHPLARLEELEFRPFQAAMRVGVDGVMTAHLYLPAIEPQQDLPATLSRTVVSPLGPRRMIPRTAASAASRARDSESSRSKSAGPPNSRLPSAVILVTTFRTRK